MENLKQKLLNIVRGDSYSVINAISGIQDICHDCKFFNYHAKTEYRCAVTGYCIGVTLSDNFKSLLLWKLGTISENEHIGNVNQRNGMNDEKTI